MIEIKDGDALKQSDANVVMYLTNCKYDTSTGWGRQVSNMFPKVRPPGGKLTQPDKMKLGTYSPVLCGATMVIGLCSQLTPNQSGDNIDVIRFDEAITGAVELLVKCEHKFTIAIPNKFGVHAMESHIWKDLVRVMYHHFDGLDNITLRILK